MPITDALTKHLKVKDLIPAAALLDGQWVERSDSGKTFEVHNPATGELLATLPDMGVSETKRAIAAAEAAQGAWAKKTGKARAVRFSTLTALCRELDCQPGDLLSYEPGPADDVLDDLE